MAEGHVFTETRELKSAPGSTVEVAKVRGGVIAAKLNAKKSLIFALYGKAKIFEEGEVLYSEIITKAEEVSIEHDIARVLFAVRAWNFTPEALSYDITSEYPNGFPVDSTIVECLTENVWNEINGIISEFWDPKPKTEEEIKNEQEPSIS